MRFVKYYVTNERRARRNGMQIASSFFDYQKEAEWEFERWLEEAKRGDEIYLIKAVDNLDGTWLYDEIIKKEIKK